MTRLFVNEWLDLPQPTPLDSIFEAMDNATRLRRASETLSLPGAGGRDTSATCTGIEDIHWASPELPGCWPQPPEPPAGRRWS